MLCNTLYQKNSKEKDSDFDWLGAPVGIEPTTFLVSTKQSTIDSQSEVIENLSLSPTTLSP